MLRASLITLIALGVAAQEPAKAPAPAPAAAPAPTPAPAPAPKPEDVILARVGGETITDADFQSAFRLLGQQEQMQLLMIQGGKEEFVKRMAESKLLSVKALRMGLDKNQEFELALKRAKDDLLAREFLTKEGPALQAKLVVGEADVKAYFDKHPERFKQPDLVSVRHILVAVKVSPQTSLVTELNSVIVTLVPSARSLAEGGSKLQAAPESTNLLVPQVKVGAVVSTSVTV